MKLGDFLNNQATKTGLQNEKALVDLLSNSALANVEISDDLAKALDGGLMSFDSAKNDINLKNHFVSQTLNGVDARLIEGLDFDNETLSAIQAEKSSYKKIDLVKQALKLQAEQNKNENSLDKNKGAEYENQVKELNAQIASLKEAKDKELKDLANKHEDEIKEFILTNQLTSKNYANKDWSVDDNVSFSKTLLQNALKEKGVIIVKDGNELKLKQANAPELDYYQENKPISFSDFTDQILSSKKMLAVNDSGANITPNTQNTPERVNNQGGQNLNTQKFDSAMNMALGIQNNE